MSKMVGDRTAGADQLDPALRVAIGRIARAPRLLAATDYDGVLAPIVDDPNRAFPLPESVAAVRALAELPQTTAAVISGRSLHDLTALSRLPAGVHLVGSHGCEFDAGFMDSLPPAMVDLHGRLLAELRALTEDKPGVRLETKPASIAVHTRTAPRDVAARVVEAVQSGPATWPDVRVTRGKEVIELAVTTNKNKGTALDTLRTRMSASAVLFLGDDVTDEDAFATLHGQDVGIKVGPGETAARYRVADPVEAAVALTLVLDTRRDWLSGEAGPASWT